MKATISRNFTKSDFEKMMMKLFPEYKFKWMPFANTKVRFGKLKGSLNSNSSVTKNLFNMIQIQYLENPDGLKTLIWTSNVNMGFMGALIFLTGILPGLLVYLIIYLTVIKKRQKEIDEIIMDEINRINRK